MNYLLKNSHHDNKAWKPIIWTFVILVLAGVFYFFAPKFSNQSLYTVARPIWNARDYTAATLNSFWSAFNDKETLVTENLSLQKKLDEARLALIDLDAYKKENDDLKKILGRSPTGGKVLAAILAKPNRSAYDTMVIDVGKEQGVKEGDKVYSVDFIIGDVQEVYKDYSKVVLASSPEKIFTVRVGDSGIDTEAVGRGGGNFIAKLPKEISIKQGDLIKSPGLEPRFFGVVEGIELTETSSFQYILFKLPVNVNSLEWVEVASKP